MLDKAQRKIDDEDYTPFYGFHCSFCRYREPCNRTAIGVGAKLKKMHLEGREKPKIWDGWDREIEVKDPELRKALALSEER